MQRAVRKHQFSARVTAVMSTLDPLLNRMHVPRLEAKMHEVLGPPRGAGNEFASSHCFEAAGG